MHIHFDGLDFKCVALNAPRTRELYEDWFVCSVSVSVPSFAGSFDWEVMASEIESFVSDLEVAQSALGSERVVRLSPAEPNVSLELAFTKLGQIEGT